MFKKKEKKDTASVFFYPSLKNTIVDTFFILFIAAIGTATYFGIDMIMSKIISFIWKKAGEPAFSHFLQIISYCS